MPRLLLVDDNPSIHKIAETLLAHSDIELVCVDSAAQALDLVSRGERFDVALIDIAMQPTDGWSLLDQFRVHPATAGLPIALMAGVLDQVDPVRLEKAPIQGFLKKPVELRELADRVQALLKTLPASPNPFATLPGTRLADLPEFRKDPLPAPAAAEVDAELDLGPLDPLEPEAVSDVLDLEEGDLWPEPEPKVAPKGPDVVHAPRPGTVTEELDADLEITDEPALDLEAFDLESLKALALPAEATAEAPAAPVAAAPLEDAPDLDLADLLTAPALAAPVPAPAIHEIPLPEPPSDLDLDELLAAPAPAPLALPPSEPQESEGADVSLEALPDLGGDDRPTLDPETLARFDEAPGILAEPAPAFDDVLQLPEPVEPEAAPAAPEPEAPFLDLGPTLTLEPTPEPEFTPEAEFTPPPAAVPAEPAASDALALARALAASPEALDALARAVVARLGDQALREVAWEILPDLAERMHNRP